MKVSVFILLLVCVFLVLPDSVHAQTSYNYNLLEPFLGGANAGEGQFPNYVQAVYTFAIWTVGIAALFMLSVGGFMYMTSAGNNASAESAKRVIRDSLFGLIVALVGYLILFTINPDLVNVNVSGVKRLTVENPDSSGGGGGGGVTPGTPAFDIACTSSSGTGKCYESLEACQAAATTPTDCGDAELEGFCALRGGGNYRCFPSESACIQGGGSIGSCMTPAEFENDLAVFGPLTEKETRKLLKDGGIDINKSACASVGAGNCTLVRGLPESAINKAIALKNSCQCEVVVTGGTEYWAHATHYPGRPIVDFRSNIKGGANAGQPNALTKHIRQNGGTPTKNGAGEDVYTMPDGGKYTFEKPGTKDEHWHVVYP